MAFTMLSGKIKSSIFIAWIVHNSITRALFDLWCGKNIKGHFHTHYVTALEMFLQKPVWEYFLLSLSFSLFHCKCCYSVFCNVPQGGTILQMFSDVVDQRHLPTGEKKKREMENSSGERDWGNEEEKKGGGTQAKNGKQATREGHSGDDWCMMGLNSTWGRKGWVQTNGGRGGGEEERALSCSSEHAQWHRLLMHKGVFGKGEHTLLYKSSKN